MRPAFTRRKLLQWLGAAAAYRAVAQEAPKGLTSGMSDPSALEYEVSARDLTVGITGQGHILALKLGFNKADIPFHACTVLDSCIQKGSAAHHSLDSGGVEFSRTYVQERTAFQCTVVDRFIPTKSSIRWEVEIVGSESPWSTPIETQLSWLSPSRLSFWTAWDTPPGTGSRPIQNASLNKLIDKLLRECDYQDLAAAADAGMEQWPTDQWSDPLVAAPFVDLDLRYGGYLGAHSAFSIPIATTMDPLADLALSLVQSPESNLLDMRLKTSSLGDVSLVRTNHRIASSSPIKLSMDLVAHAADWRGGMGWMVDRYPNYFEPSNRTAYELDGCGSYAGGEGDLDAEKLKKMAYSLNWNARFDWPYLGMSIPPVKADVTWPSWYQKPASLAKMSSYDEKMDKSGFHVLEYFNVTGGGNYIQDDPPPRKANSDSELWRDGNDYVHYQVPGSIVRDRAGKILNDGWFNVVVLDCAEPCLQKSLIEQVETLVKELPHSSGICIDRMDWLNVYNPHRDDGVSWIDGRPTRSLLISWKQMLRKLAPILHQAGKVVYANTLIARIDSCECLDGFYDEMGDLPSSLNLCALMAVRKPAIGWTRDLNTLRPNPDALFQRHLHLGVFPTVPVPAADHTIPEDRWADECYLAYGPLLAAIRGKRWVLKPHVISVRDQAARANLFQVPGGYAIPITFANNVNEVTLTLRNLLEPGEQIASLTVLHPGEAKTSTLKWQSSPEGVKLAVPVQRGCALVKVECSSVSVQGPPNS